MTPYLDTWCITCRTWHSSVWVHIGDRVIKVNDIHAPLMENLGETYVGDRFDD